METRKLSGTNSDGESRAAVRLPSWPILIGIALLIITGTVGSIMFRLGGFMSVPVEKKQASGPFLILAKEHLGAYHKIAPMISEIEAWARAHGEPCTITFGQYFDNPENTDEDRLHSRGGCVLSSVDNIKTLTKELPPEMSISKIEIGEALVAEFAGSPAIGPLKVYPKVFDKMHELGLVSSGPVLELYELRADSKGYTRYFFPVR